MGDASERGQTSEFLVTTPPSAGEPGILVGKHVGGYRMDAVIGEGPRTCVYRGLQKTLGRVVALKILKREFVKDAARIAEYLEAARSASSLIHPHIVSVFDVVSMGDLHFIASEYIEAKTLDAYLEERRTLDVEAALDLARNAAETLLHAHRMHRIHGNLIPANIFHALECRMRICDFCCRPFLAAGGPTSEAELWRAAYLAPEELRGAEPDPRWDVFALGTILFHLLVGRQPYGIAAVRAWFAEGTCPEAPAARQENPAVPQGLSDSLGRRRAYDARKRPCDMAEVLSGLEAVEGRIAPEIGPRLLDGLDRAGRQFPPPQRRNYRRMRADLDVNVKQRKTSQESAVMFLSKIKNLSENGAFVTTSEPLPNGSFVTLEFNLEARKAHVNVLGVVRWVESGAEGSGMGIQFLEVSTTDRKTLRDYVDARIAGDMARALTRTQLHKTILRILLCSWGQELSFDRLISITGSSRVLLQRTLADFEKHGLMQVEGDTIRCLRPASQAMVDSFADALR